ncbi:MAG: hypothetical protein U5R14_09670 [Gemmatimonadota bacterium]|nr:hypothetical protein [Gemmatimonadota bacterium]
MVQRTCDAERHRRDRREPGPFDRSRAGGAIVLACLAWWGCAGGAPRPDTGTELAEWQALATARPTPTPGAPSVALGTIELLGTTNWDLPSSLQPTVVVSELVTVGLLPRTDLEFVERRRFTAAVEAESRGTSRPNAPPAGVSEQPELVLSFTWTDLEGTGGTLEMRLTDSGTGAVRDAWRRTVPAEAEPVTLARHVTSGLVERLEALDLLAEPMGDPGRSASTVNARSDVTDQAFRHFARGLAAEEQWRWDRAKAGYESALSADSTFAEARAALARTARLRLGGTLADSE